MIIKIHQTVKTENALMYNERKVKNGVAEFFYSGNTISADPFHYNEKYRLKIFSDIEKNSRVMNKCLHVSVNPSNSDYPKLGYETIRTEMGALLKHLGYDNQPFFVYKHADLERVHFHIVSTRIDRQTGRKIKDSNERQKVQHFIKTLEQKYGLIKEKSNQNINFNFSADSANLKQNLQVLFRQLNQLESITNKQLYDESLERFNVEIRKSGKGHIIFIVNENGNPVRYPIRLSEFKERPRFYVSVNAENQLHNSKPIIDKFQLGQWARDLNRLVEKSRIQETNKYFAQRRRKNKYRR